MRLFAFEKNLDDTHSSHCFLGNYQQYLIRSDIWPHNCEAEVRSPSPVVPLSKEPGTQLMGQCCYRPWWPKNCDCALCNYVLYHAVVSCSHASASPCLVCCDSRVVIVRAFPQ